MIIQEKYLAFLKDMATLPAGEIEAAGRLCEGLGNEVLIDENPLIFAADFIAGTPGNLFQ